MTANSKKRGDRKWLRRLIIAMWSVTLLAIIAITTLFVLAKSEALGPMPTFDELENPKTNLATQI